MILLRLAGIKQPARNESAQAELVCDPAKQALFVPTTGKDIEGSYEKPFPAQGGNLRTRILRRDAGPKLRGHKTTESHIADTLFVSHSRRRGEKSKMNSKIGREMNEIIGSPPDKEEDFRTVSCSREAKTSRKLNSQKGH